MKIGIVGAGTIVPDFLIAARYIKDINLIAICGTERDQDNMVRFSKEYGISKVYFNYDDLLEDSMVDTVYIAVPNNLHFPFARKALDKGKNVILEKPFVAKHSEAEELAEIASEKRVYLFEAIPNIFFPNYLKVRELINELGNVKLIQINYSQYSRRYDQFKEGIILPVFDPKKAGGALLDLGVYNVHFVTGLFGMPEAVHYYANIERDIDTSGILVMEYDSMKCVCVAAKDCKAPLSINIQGDKAYIHSSSPANVFSNFEFGTNDGNIKNYSLNDKSAQERLYYELETFNTIIKRNDYEQMLKMLNHSVEVVKLMEEARLNAGLYF